MPWSPARTLFYALVWIGLLAGLAPCSAADERRLVVERGVDYRGDDFLTLKNVSLSVCKDSCLGDPRCKAFTFNTKAQWCFLKANHGKPGRFKAAISGRVVDLIGDDRDRAAARLEELSFIPKATREAALALPGKLLDRRASAPGNADQLRREAEAALLAQQPARAAALLASAVKLDPDRLDLWLELAEAATAAKPRDWQARRRLKAEAIGAAVNAYLRSDGERERVQSLRSLGRALANDEQWRPAIRTLRASLALLEDGPTRAEYEDLMAKHGFRIRDHVVDSDAGAPRICVRFSDPLAKGQGNLADYVATPENSGLAIEVEASQICVDGVEHGRRYKLLVRQGLPAKDGETLPKNAELDVYVRDRSPMVRFPGRAYVLPKGEGAGLPLISVNTELVDAAVYRIGDRALGKAVGEGPFMRQLSTSQAERLADSDGEQLWQGQVETALDPNREVTTSIPIAELVDALKPGAYVLTARPSKRPEGDLASQWFVVSDLGLSTINGNDGLHALVRSLTSATPVEGIRLRLIAKNDDMLGQALTDGTGYARFEPGLLRGSGGNSPKLLIAEGPSGDYAFLSLDDAAFDLSDRGVQGRPAPQPVDAFLTPERGAYRPGEQVHLTLIARDPTVAALVGVPLTLVVKRPDGVEHLRSLVEDQGLGGRTLAVKLPADALRGTWKVEAFADPEGTAIASSRFLVEDFLPERIDFELSSAAKAIDPRAPAPVRLEARYLYGAPAVGLAVEGSVRVTSSRSLEAHPGYRFGLAGEASHPRQATLDAATTDAQGATSLALRLPRLDPATQPRRAEIRVGVIDGGRPVERDLSLPIAAGERRLGLKPLFDGSVDEGGNAAFELIALDPAGLAGDASGLEWTLSRIETRYQWYRVDGSWRFDSVDNRTRVASGKLDAKADARNAIEAAVDWGAYELRVSDPRGALPVSYRFEAGWYVAPRAFDTPDLLKVSLDKASYSIGDTLRAHIEPRFAGEALVLVLDDRLIARQAVTVPAGGATVELPVTAEWGAGAYVTALLYRPMDLAAKRMPKRAIGLAWAGVDPEGRKLGIELELPEKGLPRTTLDVAARITNLPADGEAYVTLAAVDRGILNLTRFSPPAPSSWYFGQRKLGVALRDLYGRLIDRTLGTRGKVRSGGDAAGLSLSGPPPSQDLVAHFSGPLRVDADGRVSASFPIADFNGEVQLMAMAWSADGVGDAAAELVVRDPIVVDANMPRFLAPGDRSRLALDLTHVEGPSGELELEVNAFNGQVAIEPADRVHHLTLAEGAKAQVEIPLRATDAGIEELMVTLTTADGQRLSKALKLAVRDNQPPVHLSAQHRLQPGSSVTLDAGLAAGLSPETTNLTLSVSGAGAIDLPGLIRTLDRYPYGCAEQTVSRALPLLYLDPVATAAGLGGDANAAERIDEAIASLLGKQRSNGGFGLWGPYGGELWIDAYVTDFLIRAGEQGHAVPKQVLELALDNLANRLGYQPDFRRGGEGQAYALYVLARAGRAVIGDLRYYAETKLNGLATPMAKAQLGAALALYGEHERARAAFAAALKALNSSGDERGWRDDYGSRLRDTAAVLALAGESRLLGDGGVDSDALADMLDLERSLAEYTSTQDDAWTLLAAHALTSGRAAPRLDLGGETHEGALYLDLDQPTLAANPLQLGNLTERPLTAVLAAQGVPLSAPPAAAQGLAIERTAYDENGRRVGLDRVERGDKLLIVLTITTEDAKAGRLIIDDPLPAGLEIDNPNLVKSGDIKGIQWLDLQPNAAYKAFLPDRFVAAVNRSKRSPAQFQLAYRVRAVSPGGFLHPAATVVDMYRPERRGRTDTGRVVVAPATP